MSSLGQTPFMENALFQRALETELSRTIASIGIVDSARVHLALPARSAFLRQQRAPQASVLLSLFPGRRLERGQVQGIVNLVAAAVPELSTENVSITDQSGALLTTSDDDATTGMTSSQLDYTRQIEQDYAARIEDLLAPVVGAERVRATVAADLDFTFTEETRETFDPAVTPIRSEQTTEETRSGGDLAQGVPGALSNQPPQAVAPQAQQPGQLVQPAATPTSTSTSATRNFEIDKTISHIRQPVGSVRRLSIAVLLDYRPGGGNAAAVPQAELDSLTELARQAVGFDAARGDTITVHNSPFAEPPAVQGPEPVPFWQQPWLLTLARQLLGAALVLTLAFFIVRPIMRTLTRPQPAIGGGMASLEGGQPGMTVMPHGAYALPAGYDDRIAAVRDVAGQDPRQVAQVVRNWVAQDNA
jgi:flagellar M-ring protein FliF